MGDSERFLLDTHALIWANAAPERLSQEARRAIQSGRAETSVVSLWELILKAGRTDAPVAAPADWWRRYVSSCGVITLGVTLPHVMRLPSLPALHKDPFDRLLIAQAVHEEMVLVTCDPAIRAYPIRTLW
jgi:PIN domain nuclease of toxin-antitoxin system